MRNQGMDARTIQEINSRLFFGSSGAKPAAEPRPWQYVQMTYNQMGLTAPSYVPPLETREDAEIWMCLDSRVNRAVRLREESQVLAG